jgi:large subunit ribosomal protein L1
MPRRGKKYQTAQAKLDRAARYEPDEAMRLVKETSCTKFDGTVNCAIRLGVNPRHADQMVRGAVMFPNGTGKSVRVAVFAKGEKAKEAQDAGADVVGAEDLVDRIKEGWMEFDKAIATPDMMGLVGRIGRLLGPRGLMPNPKAGSVTFEIAAAVQDSKGGKVDFRVEKAGIVHAGIGKVGFEAPKLADNLRALVEQLIKLKPSSAKGTYIKSIAVSSTMGPGIRVNPGSMLDET